MRTFPWCTQTGEITGCAAAKAEYTPKQIAWTSALF